jgi:cytochrome c556
MRTWLRFAVAGWAIAGIASYAVAVSAQDKEALVKDRQATMKRQGADLKYIGDFVKGVGGDQAGATEKINDLLAINLKIVSLFVPGTSSADLPGKSNAKPEIWTEWDKFKAIPPVLQEAELKLAAAIKTGDKGMIGPAIGNVGKNGCGACHSNFREKLPQ